MTCLLTEIERSAAMSSTIWFGSTGLGRRLGLERQVDVHALLGQRQGRHEDDQEHEQHVDERRDVHVRTGVRHLARDDALGAVVLVGVLHYLPPAVAPGLVLRSVISADVLDPDLAQVVHRLHDRRVAGVLVALDEDDPLGLVLEHGLDPVGHRASARPAIRRRRTGSSSRRRRPSGPGCPACRPCCPRSAA